MACEFSRGGGSEASMGGQRLYFGQISCSVGVASRGISPFPIPLSQLSWCITIMALAYILSSHFGPRCEKSAAPNQFSTSSPMVFLGRMAKDGRFSPDGAFPLGREWGVSSDAVSFARFRGRRPKFGHWGHLGIKLAKIQRQWSKQHFSNVRHSQTGFLTESGIW
jgi:hypothetical protein